MITNAANRSWPGEATLADGYDAGGLPIRSVIRTASDCDRRGWHAQRSGRLDPWPSDEIAAMLRHHLGMDRDG
jgi:hypothetical protein